MSTHHVAVTAGLVALATMMLSACGADDGASAGSTQGNVATSAAANAATGTSTSSAQPDNAAPMQSAAFGASGTLANATNATNTLNVAAAPNAASAAPAPAVQNVEASLAADSQQVTPVLHYAPGDSGQGGNNN